MDSWVVGAMAGLGGVVVTSIVQAFRDRGKNPPEVARVWLGVAEGAVVVQSGVIDRLQAEGERCQKAVANLEAKVSRLEERLEEVQSLADRYRAELDRAREGET